SRASASTPRRARRRSTRPSRGNRSWPDGRRARGSWGSELGKDRDDVQCTVNGERSSVTAVRAVTHHCLLSTANRLLPFMVGTRTTLSHHLHFSCTRTAF